MVGNRGAMERLLEPSRNPDIQYGVTRIAVDRHELHNVTQVPASSNPGCSL